ncbi:MAG: iron-sulfur cluster assembly protein [Bacteroidales bacterium]|jgi:FeS assembly SUF system protein|nr:iron-sulfur cluster assembly protein [Bacteroidales bacterium]
MTPTKETLHDAVINCLRNVYDPEIPVNIYDLGLIYGIDISDDFKVHITMTLTAPDCPEAENMVWQARDFVSHIEGVTDVDIEITFDPPWDFERIPDNIKLELGFM